MPSETPDERARINAPQWTGFEGAVHVIDLYLRTDKTPDAALQFALKMDDGASPALTIRARNIDAAAKQTLQETYDFEANVHLQVDVPYLSEAEMIATHAISSRTPQGNAVIQKVLRITFGLLQYSEFDLMLVTDGQGLILVRIGAELLLNRHGFWNNAELTTVRMPWKWTQHPAG